MAERLVTPPWPGDHRCRGREESNWVEGHRQWEASVSDIMVAYQVVYERLHKASQSRLDNYLASCRYDAAEMNVQSE